VAAERTPADIDVVPQDKEVKELQAPEKSCSLAPEELKLVPMELHEIVID
jgi:hypothetical protein